MMCEIKFRGMTEDEDGFMLKFTKGDFLKEYTGDENPVFMATDIYGLHEESFAIIGNIHE